MFGRSYHSVQCSLPMCCHSCSRSLSFLPAVCMREEEVVPTHVCRKLWWWWCHVTPDSHSDGGATSLPTCVCVGKVVVVPTRLCIRKEETEEEVVVVVPHHT